MSCEIFSHLSSSFTPRKWSGSPVSLLFKNIHFCRSGSLPFVELPFFDNLKYHIPGNSQIVEHRESSMPQKKNIYLHCCICLREKCHCSCCDGKVASGASSYENILCQLYWHMLSIKSKGVNNITDMCLLYKLLSLYLCR